MKKIKLIYLFLLIPIIILFSMCNSNKLVSQGTVEFANNKVIAHRGAWKNNNHPQNSIASLKEAIAKQFAGSEFDVRMTADEVLVVTHDATYNNLDIEKSTYAALVLFKLPNGEKLPTLEEYIIAGIENNNSTRLICEIKPSKISKQRGQLIATKVVQLFKKLNAKHFVSYISFDFNILIKIKELDSTAITQYLEGNKLPIELKEKGISGLDFYIKDFKYHPEWIESAKNNNLILNSWTVDKADDMEWLLANNFDFITTDEPELLLELVKKRAISYKDYNLIWYDEFEYSGLPNNEKWDYAVGGSGYGNNEKQYYLKNSLENSIVKDGKLHIIALKKDYENNNYTSARLTTYGKFSLQYGKVEVMAKLPEGKGTWPAIWMLPESLRKKEETWPLSGEIDIMEHVGKDQNVIHTSLHTELYNHWKKNQYTKFEKVENVSNSFNLYGMEWTTESIKFYINNVLFYEAFKGENGKVVTNEGWPFDKPYFLILNLAIGGNWGGTVDDSIFPVAMEVDYVRIYQKNQ
ncbi:glycerophosphodiester phosphodiesterase family protein [Lutibacter sp.]|uniref:glycerophosphodiester phosphodiesterase family protein n=1 Tax=Lutibacter sp. TaxID=1925666 RepID=UPI0035643EBA